MNKDYSIRETENIKVVSLNDQYNVYYDGKVHIFGFIVDDKDYLLQMQNTMKPFRRKLLKIYTEKK